MIPRAPGRRNGSWITACVVGLALAACQRSVETTELPDDACALAHTPIPEVQGSGERSPLVGREVTIRGTITHLDADGLYLEQPDADDSPKTSNAIYVMLDPGSASPGQWLVASGRVAELGEDDDTLTALVEVSDHALCDYRSALPATPAELPMGPEQRESLEAMRLRLGQTLVISNPRNIGTGEVLLSLDTILATPTEVARPGADARAQADWNRRHSINALLHSSDRSPAPAGTQVFSVQGVLGHDGQAPRMLVEEAAHLRAPPRYRITPAEPGDVRVVALNLHNFFNGDGRGQGFPTERGAETHAQFQRQRERIAAQIAMLAPDVLAVMELENDGFGPFSAAADLVADLEAATGERWLPALPWDGPIGDDQITVGLFYQPERFEPLGPAEILTGPDFDDLNRHPLAQPFRDRSSGEHFVVVVNHLKSKGSCPERGRNSNLSDGQGCWNATRTSAAKAMARWARALGDAAGEGRVLIVGDMNAYRMEDPITTIIEAGLRDLTAPSGPHPNFSYIYWGAAGTLDYAFASPGLVPHVRAARILNINSVWPPGQRLPEPWLGVSDHDPVLVDLRFRSASTRD
ncbi:MAG: ExeM/NucH family extracellular endonuclease [Xanthomonadales bacterium]|nr:ExeM/NucH family extracellular endonuclease [Xanthomonadales bacterium]